MDDIPATADRHSTHPARWHGDVIRILFFGAAILMLIAGLTTATLPMPGSASTVFIIILVLTAGFMNPMNRETQWLNIVISLVGLFIFGEAAIDHYQGVHNVLDKGVFVATLALIFVITLYSASCALRAFKHHHEPKIPHQI
jgi:hypothetical protein